MTPARPRHCTECGHPWPHAPHDPWPRTCQKCNGTTWMNLIPVAVLVAPLYDIPGKYLGVRRAVPPAAGCTTCVSGFMEIPTGPLSTEEAEHHFQMEAARELLEETNLVVNPTSLKLLHVTSAATNPNNLLVFFETPPVHFAEALARFTPNAEVSELVALSPNDPIPWASHVEAMRLHAQRTADALELAELRLLPRTSP